MIWSKIHIIKPTKTRWHVFQINFGWTFLILSRQQPDNVFIPAIGDTEWTWNARVSGPQNCGSAFTFHSDGEFPFLAYEPLTSLGSLQKRSRLVKSWPWWFGTSNVGFIPKTEWFLDVLESKKIVFMVGLRKLYTYMKILRIILMSHLRHQLIFVCVCLCDPHVTRKFPRQVVSLRGPHGILLQLDQEQVDPGGRGIGTSVDIWRDWLAKLVNHLSSLKQFNQPLTLVVRHWWNQRYQSIGAIRSIRVESTKLQIEWNWSKIGPESRYFSHHQQEGILRDSNCHGDITVDNCR